MWLVLTSTIRCRRTFLRLFPDGFRDETYLDWERRYKWEAHQRWQAGLNQATFRRLLQAGRFADVARLAVAIESRTLAAISR